MSVEFHWLGNENDESGKAYYYFGNQNFVLEFPNLRKAREFEKVLVEAVQEGRKQMRFELATALTKVFNDTHI